MSLPLCGIFGRAAEWRAIALFFAIAYAVSWSIWAILFSKHLSHIHGAGFYLYLFAVLAPHFAAVLVTAFEGGRTGIVEFYGRVFRSLPMGLLVAAIAAPVVIYLARYLLGAVFGQTFGAPVFHPAPRTLSILLIGQTAVALGEEPGWRGFALGRLTNRLGVVFGSVVLGVGWAIWHLPLFIIAGTAQYGTPFLPFLTTLIAWSLIVTWFVRRARGAVIVAMLFHASANLCDFVMWEPPSALISVAPWVLAAAFATWRLQLQARTGAVQQW
jgi:uncharacterized protein